MIPVILSGGSGTRLWPMSRSARPKQFLSLLGEESLLQQTARRAQALSSEPPILICNEQHRFLAAEQLAEIQIESADILLEPVGRSTAPAIALAAMRIMERGDDIMVVMAADHKIDNTATFTAAIAHASAQAQRNKLVTLGIPPAAAETGFGYIKAPPTAEGERPIQAFVEKPSLSVAQQFVASGDYFWNSGIFIFKASVYLDALRTSRPDVLERCEAVYRTRRPEHDFCWFEKSLFARIPDVSIDYAVMEHTTNGMMIPYNGGWCDLGSWQALWNESAKDADGNSCQGDTLCMDTHDTLIRANEKLVVAIGVDDLIVVDTPDALLICHRNATDKLKQAISLLQQQKRRQLADHREVYRPWGKYDSIDNGERFQVKHITVTPGAALSVQKHHHRAEHWIVVEGTALVRRGKEQFLLSENESTYIPIGEIHALENPGKIPLVLIEVQSGAYLGEDDIVRFEDRYGRGTPAPESHSKVA